MDAANCASVKPDGFWHKLKGWRSPIEEPEVVEVETTAVSPEPALEIVEMKTAVYETITIDSLEAVHEQLFNIFYDADARRMMIADDPVLVQLELPRRWPNMECCIVGKDANEMFCARADICISHIQLLDLGESSVAIHILLAPISMVDQVIDANTDFSRQFTLILY